MLTWCDFFPQMIGQFGLNGGYHVCLSFSRLKFFNLSCPTFYVPSTIQTSKPYWDTTPYTCFDQRGHWPQSQLPGATFREKPSSQAGGNLGNAEHWRSFFNGALLTHPIFFRVSNAAMPK